MIGNRDDVLDDTDTIESLRAQVAELANENFRLASVDERLRAVLEVVQREAGELEGVSGHDALASLRYIGHTVRKVLTEAPAAPADVIVEAVRGDLLARSVKGLAKYGVHVGDNPLPLAAWLQHAYEECLDMAVYLKRAQTAPDAQNTGAAVSNSLAGSLAAARDAAAGNDAEAAPVAPAAPDVADMPVTTDGRSLYYWDAETNSFHMYVPDNAPPDAWQRIETAPADGGVVLVGRPSPAFVCEAYQDGRGWIPTAFHNAVRGMTPPPTHWQPLPAPPRKAQKP